MIEWYQITDLMLRSWSAVELVHQLDHDLLPAASPTYLLILLKSPYIHSDQNQQRSLTTLAVQYTDLRNLVLQMIALRCGQPPELALTDELAQAAYLQHDIPHTLRLLIQQFVQNALTVIANAQRVIETFAPISSVDNQEIWIAWEQMIEKLSVLVGYFRAWLAMQELQDELSPSSPDGES